VVCDHGDCPQVAQEQEEAEAIAAQVAAEEAAVAVATMQTAMLKEAAADDLKAVMPAYEAAIRALDALNR